MSYQQKLENMKEFLSSEERTKNLGVLQHFELLFDVLPQLKMRALFEKSMEEESTTSPFAIEPDPEDFNREADLAAQEDEEHEPGEEDEKDIEESEESGIEDNKDEDDI